MDAKEFLTSCFTEHGDYEFLPVGVFPSMLDSLIAFDADFMKRTGVDEGALYDDELAESELFASMAGAYPEYKMYMQRLVSDYLDYNEEYLMSIDGIEWE